MLNLLKKIPLCTALIESMHSYDLKAFFADVKSAFVVSLVALPLSMALSIAVDLPPQHGLYTAIVAGFIAPLLGGSKLQVSGPTAAFIVILAPIVTELGLRGIIWCQIIAGIFLIILGLTRTGKLISYIPNTVTTGFTAGIAIVILVLSLKDILGLDIATMPSAFIDKVTILISNFNSFKPAELILSAVSVVLLLFAGRITKLVPSPIIAVGIATIAAYFLHLYNIADIITIGDKFTYTDAAGALHHGIPPYPPHLNIPGFSNSSLFVLPNAAELKTLIMPSIIIAILAALESLLSATVADSMSGTKHNPHAELNAIGIANIFTGMFSGIPATGAIARTATLINAGGKSPLASALHAILILIFMVLLSSYAGMVPMCSLSAILFVTAFKMSHFHQVVKIFKMPSLNDKIILTACLITTAMIDMVVGVSVCVALAVLLHFISRKKS